MGSVALIATMAFPYAARSLAIGDAFEASEKDAHVLKLLGRAKDAPPARRSYLGRALAPETAEAPAESSEPTPKRQYRRRDLVPEE